MYKSVETLLVEIPTIRPHKMAVATMQTQTLVLVKITAEDGLAGWGEATTIGGLGYGEESPESVKANIETYFAPLLKSLKGLNVAQTMQAIKRSINGNRFAKCAVQTALLDIQAKRLGQPLSEVLGGRLRNSIPVLWVLASGDTGKDIAEAQKMIAAQRHNIFKLKIGSRAVEADVEHVLAIKQALGKDNRFTLEVVQMPELKINSWPIGMAVKAEETALADTVGEALRVLQKNGTVASIFARHGITYVQPTL